MTIVNPTGNLLLEQQITGTNYNAWNERYNANFARIDQAVSGVLAVDVTSADYTLSIVDSGDLNADDQTRYAIIKAIGTSASARNIIWPIGFPASKAYFLFNASPTSTTFKVAGGTGITVLPGASAAAIINGTDIVLLGSNPSLFMPFTGGGFTGTVTGLTSAVGDNSSAFSTTSFVDTAIANAPFATPSYVNTQIANILLSIADQNAISFYNFGLSI